MDLWWTNDLSYYVPGLVLSFLFTMLVLVLWSWQRKA